MARYIGPVCKLCRREGTKLFLKGDRCLTPKCAVERRAYAPGAHGQRRRKPSEYAVQLREKQKARRIYGLLERQFKRHFSEAERRPGATGENLLQILEMRLDNIIYRLGLADSRAQARQLVRHGHFNLNGVKTNVPSCLLKPGDVVTLRESSRESEYFKGIAKDIARKSIPTWLSMDARTLSGRVQYMPVRAEIDMALSEQLIVEYYSR
ncbi:MAG: 30S ribosomal protein S4 [Chloroflexi bacterium]|nr:30S ribosomal protein S4 [Chloroflexota bacterium]MBI5955839.1 30S ribosomal protein S4 [Chloroflexota bacterium]